MKRTVFATCLLLGVFLSLVSSTIAATLIFDGGNNTTNVGSARTWSTGTSWNTETAPATGDDLVIGGTALNGGILVLGSGSYMAMTATANSTYAPTLRSVTFDNSLSQFPVGGLEMRNSSSATPGNNVLNLNTPDIDALVLKGGTAPALTFISRSATAPATATLTINLNYSGQANFAVNSGGTLTFDGLNNGSTPMITGTGGITKTGNGTLSLINVANTFSGGLTITEGTVSVATANRLGGELALNATAVVLNGGTLLKTGNTTTTSISNRGFALGNANGTINVADPAGVFIVNGVIADVLNQTGALTKTGPGTLNLNATNTFSGGLTLNGGTLSIDTTLGLGNASIVNTNHFILANGTLQFTGNSSTTVSANRGMRVGSATSVIEIVNESATLRLLNSVRDVSGQAGVLTKSGLGSLSLEGSTYSYTGGTLVVAGTLVVNGGTIGGNVSLAGITLATGTTLRGNGTFNGNSTIAAGSKVDIASYDNSAQTAAVGSLNFNQNLTLGSASLLYDLDTPATSDLINLAPGAALDIGSGTVDLANFVFTTGSGFAPGVYTLISSTSPIVGTLGSTTTGTLAGQSITLGKNTAGTALQLTVGTPPPIDTTAPAAPTVGLLAASDTGSSSSDLITKLTTPTLRITLNGTGPTAPLAGDVVKLFNGATQVASATLSAGDITATYVDLTTSVLAPGIRSLTATVTDAASNVSASSNALTVTLDTTAPVITVTSPSSNSAAWGANYTDAGATASDNNAPFSATVNTTNPVSPATPGVYTVTYNATDVAGNPATPATRTVTVAIANPTTAGADGLSPLMKYAFGATSPTDTVQAPVLSSTASTLALTAVVRTNDAAVAVTGEAVDSLTGTWGTGGTVTMTIVADQTNLPANCQRRVFTVPLSGTAAKFLRLKVVNTP